MRTLPTILHNAMNQSIPFQVPRRPGLHSEAHNTRPAAAILKKINPYPDIRIFIPETWDKNAIRRFEATAKTWSGYLDRKHGRYSGRSSRDGATVLGGREKQFESLRAARFSVLTKHGGSE